MSSEPNNSAADAPKIKWSVRQKIMGIATSMIIFSIAVSVFSSVRLLQVKHELVDLAEYTIPITDLLSIVDIHTLEQELHLQRVFKFYEIEPLDQKLIDQEWEKFEKRGHEVDREIKKAEELAHEGTLHAEVESDVAFYRDIDESLKAIEKEHQDFHDHAVAIVEHLRKGEMELAEELELKLQHEEDHFNKHVEEILHKLQRQTLLAAETADKHEQEVFWLVIVATVVAVVAGLLYAMVIIKGFLRPISDLAAKMHLVDQGDLDVDVVATTSDEIGQLSRRFNAMIEELRLKDKIEDTFGKYVDPRVVEKLLEEDGLQGAEGEKRRMTVLFAGLAGLDNLSHDIEPEALMAFYNDYMEILDRPLTEHKGVLNDFVGTVITGFWGPPFTGEDEHAGLALNTAADLIAALPELDALIRNRLGDSFQEGAYDITIGVATGELIVGNMGSANAMSYKVLGDVVNNASRLKGASRQYGVAFLCAEETAQLAGPEFRFREVDEILAVGMDNPIKIYESLPDQPSYAAYTDDALALYSKGLEAYRQGDWAGAKQAWTAFAAKAPRDKAVQILLARLPQLEAAPPADWAGVWRLTEK